MTAPCVQPPAKGLDLTPTSYILPKGKTESPMYLTMNRFRVIPGQEDAFEAMWTNRDSHLKEVPGFVSFHLMRGEIAEGARLYASHTLWRDKESFLDWTKSEAFRAAHKGAKSAGEMYVGPPVLECFDSVQEIAAD